MRETLKYKTVKATNHPTLGITKGNKNTYLNLHVAKIGKYYFILAEVKINFIDTIIILKAKW